MTYAEHASVCWICEDMIHVGDRIVPGSPRWIHQHCEDDEPSQPACGRCHLHHPGDCT